MTNEEYLKEEVRDNYLVTSDIKKIWHIELDMLKEFIKVCNKYNLKFFADGGTLLGAIRHRGFIPWDDDIDLIMLRDDYDILIHKAAKEFCTPYFLQTAYSDKNYIRLHAQLRNIKTTAILKEDINQQFNQGIFIDIFVLDGVSKDPMALFKQEKNIRFYRRLLRNIFYSKIEKAKHIFTRLLPKLIFGRNNNHIIIFRKLEKEMRKIQINEVDCVSNISFYGHVEKILDKHWYDNTILFDFEGIKLPVPANYHEVLSVSYGNNYMTPIQQPTYHGSIIFDTDCPSEDVLNALRKQSNNKT
jgi:lipopolysaccharide cholinephosphotransferase